MIRHMLVPLDGSPLAESVLPCVLEFAHLTGADVTLLWAMDTPEMLADVANAAAGSLTFTLESTDREIATYRAIDGKAATYLDTVAQQLASEGIVARSRLVSGPAAEAIIEAARGVDLIAMATHGRSGIGRWVYGSVADKVLRGAPVPVLLIRVGQDQIVATGYPQRILVPLDGSALAEQVLPLASALARRAGAQLVLMRGVSWAPEFGGAKDYIDVTGIGAVNLLQLAEEEAQSYLTEIGERLRRQGLTVQTDLRVDAPADAILASAAEHQVDLIVMSTHGRSGLRRWVYGSVADKVLRSAIFPVLLVRAGVPVEADPLPQAASARG